MPPEASGDSTPEGGHQAVFPVDDSDVLVAVDGGDDLFSDFLRFEHHRIMEIATEQGRIDKAWTDVGEVDFQTPCIGLLFQGLQVDILHGFGGRIAWGRAEAFGASYRGDGCDMTTALLGKVTIGLANHSGETQAIGLYSGEFDVFLKFPVLSANA